jgi:hypothetical protein
VSETIDDVAKRLSAAGANIGGQVRRLIERMVGDHRLAQRVFLGPDGKPTPAAAEWLRRLARDNHVESSTWAGDRDAMLINEGKRKLAMKILASVNLDTERLASLSRLEREVNE